MQKAALQRSRHLAPGDKLGKYELIRQVAVGGMAELYLARTVGIEGFEKLVVVKRILPQYVSNQSFVNMFLNEARLAATLHHPNVAQVYDIGVEEGDYFFAMEYVHGEDLDHMHIAAEEQGVPISMDAALTLAAGLCAGLHYAHDKASPDGKPLGIVHRDVSPSNVLVSYDGAVKLVDFGIARASTGPGTTQGGLKGKIAYMSPEQCRAKSTLDRRSDIYSVGTMLYLLTTGRTPFKGETEYQVLSQIVNDDVPPPSTFVPGYPPALEKIVVRALQRDPDKRYSTALELQGAIEDFAHESRLRVSALVLARLMGTLFPARLEEWDSAKKQGAFFVEQHVVRTLIESGRTPDRSDPVVQNKVARAVATDDDPTQINQAPFKQQQQLDDLGGDTVTGIDPISAEPSSPARVTQIGPPVVAAGRPPTPIPQAFPITPGVLVTSSTGPAPAIPRTPTPFPGAVVQATPATIDVTERVRAPARERQTSPTKFVRTESKRGLMIAIFGSLAVAGGIAAFIITRGGDEPIAAKGETTERREMTPDDKAEKAEAVEKAEPTEKADEKAEPVEVEKAAGTEPAEGKEPTEAKPDSTETKPVETAAKPDPKPEPVAETKPEVKKPTKTPVVATKKATKKVEKKTEPKEQKPWSNDSIFMPVRTGK